MTLHGASGGVMLLPNSPKQNAYHHRCPHKSGRISAQLSFLIAFLQAQARHHALQQEALNFFHHAVSDSVLRTSMSTQLCSSSACALTHV